MRRISKASGVQELIDGLTYQVFLIDAKHRIHVYNRAAAKKYGKALTASSTPICHTVIFSSRKPHAFCPLPAAVKTGNEEHKMVRTLENAWNRISIYPTDLKTEAGDRLYLHTIRDASQVIDDSLELVLRDELLNRVGESIFVIDRHGAIRYSNRAAYEDRGYTEEEFLRLTIKDINLRERASFVKEQLKEVLRKGQATFETIHKRKDGSTFPVEITSTRFQFANIDGVIAVARDITERKRAEEVQREKDAMKNFGFLADNAHDGVLVLSGSKGNIVYANQRIARITGYIRSELVSIDTREILRPAEIKSLKDRAWKHVGDKSMPRTYESFLVNKQGESIPVELSASKTSWSGQPAIVALFRDITERRRTEELLQEKRTMENFRSLIGDSNDGVLVVRGKGEFAYANKQMAQITGYSIDELTSMHLRDLAHTGEVKRLREVFKNRVEGVSTPQTHETVLVKKSGEALPVEVTGAKTVWQDQPAVVVTFRDISRRKTMEDTIGKQYAQLNAVLESNTGPVFSVDTKGCYTSFNSAHVVEMKQTYGADIERGKSLFDYMTVAEDRKKGEKVLRRVLKGETFSEETYYGDEAQSRRYYKSLHSPIKDRDGNVVGGSVFTDDITLKKQAEKAIQEKEALEGFKLLAENANDGVAILSGKKGTVVYANKRIEEMGGYTARELATMGLKELGHPDEHERIKERYRKRLTGEFVPRTYETRVVKKNGDIFSVELTAAQTTWHGQPADVVIFRDISERKKTEELLREKQIMENFQTLVGDSNDGVLVIWGKGEFAYANDRMTRMTGYSTEELTLMYLKDLASPGEVKHVEGIFKKRLKGAQAPPTYESAIVKKSGEILPVEVTGAKTVWKGKPATVVTYRDISERKTADAQIRLISTLLESSVDTVFVHDEEGHFYYVNEAAYRDRGYTKEELMKMNLHELDTPEYAKLIEPRIKKMHAQKGAKKSLIFESTHFRKDGSVMPVEVHASFIEWQGKNLVFAHIIDLSERKAAEEIIERERDAAQNYLDIAQVMIVAINAGGKVAMINTYGADLLGYPVEAIVGENWFENFLPRDEKGSVRKVFDRLSKNGIDEVEIVQNNVVSSDGTKHLIRWHNTYVKDKEGNLLYTLSSGEDVTEVVEAQAKLGESYERLEHVVDGIIGALATTVETRDPYTANHQRRVAKLSVAIAGKLRWTIEDQKVLESAAMIHDIGKMYIPAEVLNKPGKLDSLEFELIKLHSASAYEILKNIDFAGPVATIVRQHHERLDGSGYPDGLKNKQIEPGARIMAVADVVEAMSSDRPYRPSCGLDEALKEVQDRKGELYDKKAVNACVALFKKDHFSFD